MNPSPSQIPIVPRRANPHPRAEPGSEGSESSADHSSSNDQQESKKDSVSKREMEDLAFTSLSPSEQFEWQNGFEKLLEGLKICERLDETVKESLEFLQPPVSKPVPSNRPTRSTPSSGQAILDALLKFSESRSVEEVSETAPLSPEELTHLVQTPPLSEPAELKPEEFSSSELPRLEVELKPAQRFKKSLEGSFILKSTTQNSEHDPENLP